MRTFLIFFILTFSPFVLAIEDCQRLFNRSSIIQQIESTLDKKLDQNQKEGVFQAYLVGEEGDGHYGFVQILNKARILKKFFSKEEIRTLIKQGFILAKNIKSIASTKDDQANRLSRPHDLVHQMKHRSEYYYDRAAILFKDQQFQKSLKDINKAISLDSKMLHYYQLRASIYSEIEKYKEAISDMDRVIDQLSNNATDNSPILAESFFFRGALKLYSGKFKDAIEDLELSIMLEPGMIENYLLNGVSHFILGHHRVAEKNFQIVEDYFTIPHQNLEGDYIITFKVEYSELIKPSLDFIFAKYGILNFEKNNYQSTINSLDEIIKKYPKNIGAYVFRGKIKSKIGKHDEAIDDFNKAFENIDDPVWGFLINSDQ